MLIILSLAEANECLQTTGEVVNWSSKRRLGVNVKGLRVRMCSQEVGEVASRLTEHAAVKLREGTARACGEDTAGRQRYEEDI